MNSKASGGRFVQLHRSGKVKAFGVSNFTSSQIELLQAAVKASGMVRSSPAHPREAFTLAFAGRLALGGRANPARRG